MNTRHTRGGVVQRGFTLIELMITLAMVAILASLAAPSFTTMMANQQLSTAASELMTSALQARSLALKNNRRVLVQPITNGDWLTGWRVYEDAGLDGAFVAGTDPLFSESPPLASHITVGSLTGSGDNRSIALIAYGGDGFLVSVTLGGNANYNGSVLFSSTRTTRTKYVVVARTGRIRLCDPLIQPGCAP